jgi:hypothetical protein
MSLPIQISNVVIYGNSPKFIAIIHNLYPDANVTILPWRTSDSIASEILAALPAPIDLLLICGYDYHSYCDTQQNYLHKNVCRIVDVCKKIANDVKKIIYIDTLDTGKSYTFSRYLFAKKRLAQELSTSVSTTMALAIPTVYDKKNSIGMQGGALSQIAAKFLIQSGIIQTIDLKQLQHQLKSTIETTNSDAPLLIKLNPILIGIPRPQFIDRILRMALG